MASLSRQIADIQSQIDDLYNRPMALGTQKINSHLIKAKTITANDLDVSDLQSVSQNTGNLVITGSIAAGTGLSAMGWNPTNGIYLGNTNPALAPFSVSPSGDLKGTAATITGNVTATTLAANGSGSIAGWTIDSSKLSQGNVGIGNSSGYRIWSGLLASPSLANFSVDNTGNIKAAAGSIAGFTVDSAKFATDSGNTGFGQSGGQRIWAGGSPGSAPFRVDSTGSMVSTGATISGAVTATSGSFTGTVNTGNLTASGGSLSGLNISGTLTIGGQITWNSGLSYINSTGMVLRSAGSFADAIVIRDSSGVNRISLYADSSQSYISLRGAGAPWIYATSSAVLAQATNGCAISVGGVSTGSIFTGRVYPGLLVSGSPSSQSQSYIDGDTGVTIGLLDSVGVGQFKVMNTSSQIVMGASSSGQWIREITNDSTALGSYYGRIPIYINGNLRYLGVYN